ncbi:hypothetical protein AGLY_016252 [Aphis glycines]|uniref:TTF-type domain-containing protein n=1 Tax=Aphis glycines TaxID=307491 RepID=A0A6G0SZC0_APHGL|nr:hypothetical protein AGLY_016252 [Aphis glycines]
METCLTNDRYVVVSRWNAECFKFNNMECSDIISEILKVGIHNYSFEHELQLKTKKPTPRLSLETVDGKTKRKFQVSWYTKYAWLSGSENLGKLFCYYCLLFRGEKTWGSDGISVMKNFDRKASKHAISKTHLTSQEQFMLLGANRIEHALSEGCRLAAIKHNENVSVNRRILKRLIHVVCFLGKQEIAFRGHNEDSSSINKGNYLELLDLLSREEQLLREHFMSNSVFKGTSSDIQNDLISCITSVLKTKISNELKKANFISIQADETTDVSCKSQMSIIFRYVVDNKIEERFIGFFDVSKDKSAFGLSEILLTEIKNWYIGGKLMCQTYDGAAVMAGQKNGVQAIIKQSYPKRNVHTFRSPKRSQLLREKGFKLPQSCETRWNYHSRAAATITTHFIELKKAITYRDLNLLYLTRSSSIFPIAIEISESNFEIIS